MYHDVPGHLLKFGFYNTFPLFEAPVISSCKWSRFDIGNESPCEAMVVLKCFEVETFLKKNEILIVSENFRHE